MNQENKLRAIRENPRRAESVDEIEAAKAQIKADGDTLRAAVEVLNACGFSNIAAKVQNGPLPALNRHAVPGGPLSLRAAELRRAASV